ncbi:hypothetical protein [Micromonospora sagamiensis]|uniref:hypothetical protein n=1 Tax=Micromonospora sagamiensis TaxID=47875 RepID=UPI001647CE79|nr:hypothetical protein [Micromonospora sagamiensis]
MAEHADVGAVEPVGEQFRGLVQGVLAVFVPGFGLAEQDQRGRGVDGVEGVDEGA